MKSTAKATEKRSRTVVVLAIAVALMLLGSIFVIVFLSVCKIPYADYKVSVDEAAVPVGVTVTRMA